MKNKTQIQKKVVEEKINLHPRNKHRARYNFEQLIKAFPALEPFVFINAYNNESIDFSNPAAVLTLNKALLKHFYNISNWQIPAGYLCPPVPGRADYIHYMADLLAADNNGIIPKGPHIKVLDIGVGANCIYPIIGNHEYGWSFTGTDTDAIALGSAKKITETNLQLSGAVKLSLQNDGRYIFKDVVNTDDQFTICICNPPFHASIAEAKAGSLRKIKNLGYSTGKNPVLNFGGQASELSYKGGEEGFVRIMINESVRLPSLCLWYSTLISKKETLPAIYSQLQHVKAVSVKTIEMAQGQKISRIIAWTFLTEEEHKLRLSVS